MTPNNERDSQMETGRPADHVVNKAQRGDYEQVARILGEAFGQDPVFNWFCQASPALYASMFRSELMNLYRHHDHVFINQTQTGASMWLPPGISTHQPARLSAFVLLTRILVKGGLKSLKRGDYLQTAMAKAHLKEPHFYLHAIGAVQGSQGKGIGSAMLKHGVRLADEARKPAYLESSNIRNNPLYERFGFEITEEIQLPDDGPSIWSMKRPVM